MCCHAYLIPLLLCSFPPPSHAPIPFGRLKGGTGVSPVIVRPSMSGETPDLHKSLLKSTTLETLVSSLLYQCLFEIGLCITKEGGMAVSAVLRLVHLLAPYPSELWHPLPYTGGASGSERRLCHSSKVQKLSAWPETFRPLQRRPAALQILLGGDFFVRELWGCLMVSRAEIITRNRGHSISQ